MKPLFILCIFPGPFLFVFRGDRRPETDVRAVKNDRRRASGHQYNRTIPTELFPCFSVRSTKCASKANHPSYNPRKPLRDHNPDVVVVPLGSTSYNRVRGLFEVIPRCRVRATLDTWSFSLLYEKEIEELGVWWYAYFFTDDGRRVERMDRGETQS